MFFASQLPALQAFEFVICIAGTTPTEVEYPAVMYVQ